MGELYDYLDIYKTFSNCVQNFDESSQAYANRVYLNSQSLAKLFLEKELETLSHFQLIIGLVSDEIRNYIIRHKFSFEYLLKNEIKESLKTDHDHDDVQIYDDFEVYNSEGGDNDDDDDESVHNLNEEMKEEYVEKAKDLELKDEDALITSSISLKCQDCTRPFLSKESLDIHRTESYKCENCDKLFHCKIGFWNHKKVAHPSKWKCCNKSFDTSIDFSNHKKEFHKDFKPINCFNCDKLFTNKREYEWHIDRMCKKCNLCFKSIKATNTHSIAMHHEPFRKYVKSRAKCPLCSKTFVSEFIAKRHFKQVHLKYKHNFVCPKCSSFTTYSQKQLDLHIKKVHPLEEDSMFCKECGLELTQTTYYTHMTNIHNKQECKICKQILIGKNMLRKHYQEIHQIAPKSSVKNSLSKKIGREKTHMCHICSNIFTTKAYLKTHIEGIHGSDKKFKCNQCDYGANNQQGLKIHTMRKHTNERPFICAKCGKGFVENYKLKNHTEVVHNKASKNCNICNATIIGVGYGNIKTHQMNVHKKFTYKEWEQSTIK